MWSRVPDVHMLGAKRPGDAPLFARDESCPPRECPALQRRCRNLSPWVRGDEEAPINGDRCISQALLGTMLCKCGEVARQRGLPWLAIAKDGAGPDEGWISDVYERYRGQR